ncbi:MAG: DUF4349 domain-containing protein, partial [Clostridia bacterium]|nr:DUF4349 domain-containing protein [Clostridia bacterium]
MKTKQKLISLALAIILVLAFAACGAASKDASSADEAASEMAPEIRDSYTSQTDYTEQSTNDAEDALGAAGSIIEVPTSEKIIYSGSAEVETMEFDKTIEDLAKMVSDIGGFVQSSSVTGSDFYAEHSGGSAARSALYVFRIPANTFKSFTENLSTLGNVPYSSTNAENITMQYTDTESRLTACRTKEARLLELLSRIRALIRRNRQTVYDQDGLIIDLAMAGRD